MTEWKQVYTEVGWLDWRLETNDKDQFRIVDMMTGDSIVIEQDDKEEFSRLISLLQDELFQETPELDED